MSSTIVVQQCPFKWDSMRDCNIEVELSDDKKKLEIYTIEGEQRGAVNAQFKQNYSCMKKYEIDISNLQ